MAVVAKVNKINSVNKEAFFLALIDNSISLGFVYLIC